VTKAEINPATDPFLVRAPAWAALDTVLVSLITLAGLALRVIRLGVPSKVMFDEIYYAKDACFYIYSSQSICEIAAEQNQIHPPLGKWLLALGIRIFGYDAFGWRVAAAVAGALTIALVYLLARKLLRSTLGAAIASGLLAIDLLHFVQSRIAMLDIFVSLFGVAAVLFAVYDRDRIIDEANGVRHGTGLLDRPWRLAAGVAGGAATAAKWPGGFALLGVIILTIAWEVAARRARGAEKPWLATLREEGTSIALWLVILPLVVYIATFFGRLSGDILAAPWSEGSFWRDWWGRQTYMFEAHRTLGASHPYASPPWSWPLLKRPVSYEFKTAPNGDYMEIFATGSPLVWWASLIALAACAYSFARRRGLGRPEGVILAGFGFAYGPWLLVDALSDRTSTFLFYMLPAVPFMCIALAWAALELGDSWEARAARALFGLAAVALFAFYYPLTAFTPLPQPSWQKRIWVFDNCDKPPGTPSKTTVTTTVDGTETTSVTETTDNSSLPPTGWCWI
jgi:dolichyl-phosphate-mannose--protein O-mannosyl transferase